jgi:hypothetical protein
MLSSNSFKKAFIEYPDHTESEKSSVDMIRRNMKRVEMD